MRIIIIRLTKTEVNNDVYGDDDDDDDDDDDNDDCDDKDDIEDDSAVSEEGDDGSGGNGGSPDDGVNASCIVSGETRKERNVDSTDKITHLDLGVLGMASSGNRTGWKCFRGLARHVHIVSHEKGSLNTLY